MKKTTLIALLLFAFTFSNAQNTNTEDAKKIKALKTIVALSEYPKKADATDMERIDSLNSVFRFAMQNYWNFNEITDYLPLTQAKEFIKNNEGYCYVAIDVGVSRSMTHQNANLKWRYISSSEKLTVYLPKPIARVFLPQYSGPMTRATSVFAAVQLNRVLDLLYKGEIPSILGSRGYVKRNGPNLIKRTLLIPREYVSPKLSQDDIKLAYPYDLDLCDLDKIENAILNKDPKYAVVFHVPLPVGGKVIHRLYISNAADGDIYGVSDGNTVDFGVQKPKDFLINEKELKQIAKWVQ